MERYTFESFNLDLFRSRIDMCVVLILDEYFNYPKSSTQLMSLDDYRRIGFNENKTRNINHKVLTPKYDYEYQPLKSYRE